MQIHSAANHGLQRKASLRSLRYGRFFHSVHWLNCRDPDAMNAEVAACGAAMQLPNWPDEESAQVDCTINSTPFIFPLLGHFGTPYCRELVFPSPPKQLAALRKNSSSSHAVKAEKTWYNTAKLNPPWAAVTIAFPRRYSPLRRDRPPSDFHWPDA